MHEEVVIQYFHLYEDQNNVAVDPKIEYNVNLTGKDLKHE